MLCGLPYIVALLLVLPSSCGITPAANHEMRELSFFVVCDLQKLGLVGGIQ